MAPADVTTLSDLADLLLTVSLGALQTTTAGAPAISYVSPAAPAFDCCPALILYVAALTEETTSPTAPIAATGMRGKYGRISLATYVILALRCAPKVSNTGVVLTSDATAVAHAVQEDGWALWNGVSCAIKNEVFEDLCSIVHIDRGQVIAEQGGCVGWQFTIRAEIPGIPCAAAST
jgi:hypothetical protein